MERSRPAAFVLRRIERYQQQPHRRQCCRFTPTCSHYGHEAFETRAFPVAVLLVLGRLARCNPLTNFGTVDPVRRGRRGPRANAARTASVALLLAGLGVIVFSGAGWADAVNGNCTGGANGRPVEGITKGDPLILREGDRFSAQGTASFNGPDDKITTVATIQLIKDLFKIKTDAHKGTGSDWSSDTVNVDDYFKYGLGLYRVDVKVTGKGTCTATGWVELKGGNPLTKPVGGGAAVVGTVGLFMTAKAKNAKNPKKKKNKKDFVDQVMDASDADAARAAAQKPNDPLDEIVVIDSPAGTMCIPAVCGPFLALSVLGSIFLLPLRAMPLFGMAGGSSGKGASGALWSKRVIQRGRPVLGFFGGLLFGFGASILLWQYAVWTLTTVTFIAFPLVVAALASFLAWSGTVYRLRVPAPAASPSAPATA